ncbi:MAG TPA: hypothetical protein VLE89_00730 [Chlamydiales bacterium]|nr:hypothetical protein [Chlamydiales bacterium]
MAAATKPILSNQYELISVITPIRKQVCSIDVLPNDLDSDIGKIWKDYTQRPALDNPKHLLLFEPSLITNLDKGEKIKAKIVALKDFQIAKSAPSLGGLDTLFLFMALHSLLKCLGLILCCIFNLAAQN